MHAVKFPHRQILLLNNSKNGTLIRRPNIKWVKLEPLES